jgi:carboxylesterase
VSLGSDWMQHPELNGEAFYLPGNSIGFLLIHGFTATTTEVRPLAMFLNQKGYTVSAPLLPGHGTNPVDLNSTKWKDWVNCVEDAYQQLQAKCQVIFIGGESMGGLLTLFMANKHPEVKGLLLYAPALKILQLGRAFLLSFLKDFRWKTAGDQTMPWKGYKVVPLQASRQLYWFRWKVFHSLPRITQPVLIIQGKQDRSLDLHGAEVLLQRIGSNDKTLVWFDQSQHCILLDQEFSQVAKTSLDFILRILNEPTQPEML